MRLTLIQFDCLESISKDTVRDGRRNERSRSAVMRDREVKGCERGLFWSVPYQRGRL
jgi:hypothetical protein